MSTAVGAGVWTALPMGRTHLAVVTGVDSIEDLTGQLEVLRTVMRAADPRLVVLWRLHPTARCAVVVVAPADGSDAPPPTGDRVVWGVPAGATDFATDAGLDRLLAEPVLGRDVAGVWIAIGPHGDGARVVTSPHVIHTLKHVSRGGRAVFATRSTMAIILAGMRPTIRRDVIAELITLDFVMGDDDLFAGATVLPEAAVVDITGTGVAWHSYLSLEERVAERRPRADHGRLADALGQRLERWTAIKDLELGLTAGVDSTLIAEVAAARGLDLQCFTMGPADLPDVTEAADTADRLGFPHHRLDLTSPDGYKELVARTALSDGQESARNVVGGGPAIDCSTTWIGGWGGEIGRAFYWADQSGPFRADDVMSWLGTGLPPSVRTALLGRLSAELAELRRIAAGDDSLVLDLFYLAHRLRKWLGRLPPWQVNGLVGAYLDPRITSELLSGTPAERRLGATFGRPEREPPTSASDARAREHPLLRSVAGSALRRVRSAVRARPHIEAYDWPPLDALLCDAGDSVEPVIDALGTERWTRLLHDGRDPTHPEARRALWNALSIAAAHEWCESLPGELASG